MNKIKSEKYTGVILAGGKSSRMNVNKSLLHIDGITLIEHLFNMMSGVFENVVISTNQPELYDFIPAEKIQDVYPNYGPLAGIHSAFVHTNSQKIFIVSTDMVFLQTSVIKYLLDIRSDEPIILPKAEEIIQYLCGIYDRSVFSLLDCILKDIFEAKKKNVEVKYSALSLWNFVDRIGAGIADVEFERFYFNDLFFSINTPEDFEYAKTKLIF